MKLNNINSYQPRAALLRLFYVSRLVWCLFFLPFSKSNHMRILLCCFLSKVISLCYDTRIEPSCSSHSDWFSYTSFATPCVHKYLDVAVETYKFGRVKTSETIYIKNMRTQYSLQLRLLACAFHSVFICDDNLVLEIGLGKSMRIVSHVIVNFLLSRGYFKLVMDLKSLQHLPNGLCKTHRRNLTLHPSLWWTQGQIASMVYLEFQKIHCDSIFFLYIQWFI